MSNDGPAIVTSGVALVDIDQALRRPVAGWKECFIDELPVETGHRSGVVTERTKTLELDGTTLRNPRSS
jgi:hypothetical protein